MGGWGQKLDVFYSAYYTFAGLSVLPGSQVHKYAAYMALQYIGNILTKEFTSSGSLSTGGRVEAGAG